MADKKTQIVIEVSGGVVQAVFSNNPELEDIEIYVSDYDTDGTEDFTLAYIEGYPVNIYEANVEHRPMDTKRVIDAMREAQIRERGEI